MANRLIEDIVANFKTLGRRLLLVNNPDAFLSRSDCKLAFAGQGIRIVEKKGISLRIDFELNYKKDPENTIYLIAATTNVLADIKNVAVNADFQLSTYFPECHLSSILELDLEILNKLYLNKPAKDLSKRETENFIQKYCNQPDTQARFNFSEFKEKRMALIRGNSIDWMLMIELLSESIMNSIGTNNYEEILEIIESTNLLFQEELEKNYKNALNANSIKRPRVVSSILDHIASNHKEDKVALIVVDGMAYWQYLMFEKTLSSTSLVKNDITYAWIPTITQLSRQAIFKGGFPEADYIQNPKNEQKLWISYWENKGLNKFEIRYDYDEFQFEGLDRISKLAVVFKDLDEKMHSSTDFVDLKSLTNNWLDRTGLVEGIRRLTEKGFTIFLTADHGNVQAKGWRGLNGREKLGTNKSGSRSLRHIEYSESWLAEDFFKANPEMRNSVVQDDKVLYLKNNLSFSSENKLVTHGGSHILEVVVPFVKITQGPSINK